MSVRPIVIPFLYMVVVPHASQTLPPPPLLLSEPPLLLSHLHLINKQYQKSKYLLYQNMGLNLFFTL